MRERFELFLEPTKLRHKPLAYLRLGPILLTPLLRSPRTALQPDAGVSPRVRYHHVEVPIDEWLPNGTRVRLEFEATDARIVLPSDGGWFVAEVAPR